MARQIQANVSILKISDIYQKIKNQTLIPQPEFQRKFVWNRAHKEKLIDTILKGYPFPEIYTAQKGINLETIESQDVVVDGQQRLRTIVQYIDELQDSKEFGKLVKKYKDLTPDEKRDFLKYEVVFRNLGDVNPETIIEIFKRINLTQYSLNQVEIENAVYDGEFITVSKEILASVDLSFLSMFSESEISRMDDLYFILLIMSTIENRGYFNRVTEVEKYIVAYNDSYEKSDEVKDYLISAINTVKALNLEPDTIWYRKSNIFTLLIELNKLNVKFSWDDIPGKDNERLIEYLAKKFDIDWTKTAKIEKIEEDRTIKISTEMNYISLRLNDDKIKVNITIDDIEKDELITKIENGKLFIYNENLNLLREKLTEFERNIITNKNADKNSNDFSRYYSYMYTGTNSRQARIVRAELIKKYVFSELN